MSAAVVREVLDSGVTVLVDRMTDVRSFSLGFFVRAGSEAEPAGRRGLSHFLEHLLFKRTRRRSNVEIARAIDRLGGDVDAFTTKEYTGFYCRTLDARFGEALDLLADVVLAPAFTAADVEIERGVILEEIGEANDNPEDLAHENFVRAFWKDHPLGAPILGTPATVRAIRREDLSRYYRARYTPRNLIVAVAGHVDPAAAVAAIEKLFRRRPGRRHRKAAGAERAPRPHAHVLVRPRPGLEQAHLCIGMPASSQTSGRRYAASLLDVVLGGGMSSRLFQEVRERRGLVYTIGSSLSSYRLAGYEAISAACAPKNLPRVIEVTLRELSRLKRSGVRPRELAWAKENLTSNMVLALESTVSRMSSAARQEFYLGRIASPEELLAKVEAVTADEVGEEAGRALDGGSLSVSVVGNVGKLALTPADLASAL
ncbi:MAG TPA: pitrilysin family protein [Thermoanaerobaculia bacterium]|jgi:predicted Zn-dependent peptidase|nr:pitrilysin family protein [Thermoanaerobaculia bacterium]